MNRMIVAEISANHLGEIDRALALIEAAAWAGADAVKLQTYTPDSITIDCDGEDFVIDEGPWKGMRLYELYQRAATPLEWHARLFEKARDLNVACFSSPFSIEDVKFLQQFNPPYYKIASFEITDVNLIHAAAMTRKPIIISTGMADEGDIVEAIKAASFAESITLLHCVSMYPTPVELADLNRIKWLQQFNTNVGISDHSLSIEIPVAASALGVSVIEKHLTLSRADGGPDASFSLEPWEFKKMVDAVHDVRTSLSYDAHSSIPCQRGKDDPHFNLRRSLYVVKDVKAGEEFTNENVRSIRPGYGLPPKYLGTIIGKRAASPIQRGTPMSMELVR